MNIGTLDRRITIEQPTDVQNTRGEVVSTSWTTFATIWARKEPLGGDEGQTARQQFGTASYRWQLRYLAGVTLKMRVNEGGVLFDVTEVDETRRRQGELHLITTQRGV